MTKPYHNLLGIIKGEDERSFYWDGNIAAMSEQTAADAAEEKNLPFMHYYLQDELGSPVRVSGYDKDHLTYGYDEFGNDLYKDMEEAGIPNPYSRQGEEQPFGYTGYRHDDISGTYFAQAREYQPENGRFTAEDVIKNGVNWYIYCRNNPRKYVDLRGLAEYVIGDPTIPEQDFDEDFVYNPDAKITIIDRVGYALWGLGNSMASLFLPEATDSYEHYRSGSGDDITIDLSRALEEDKSYNMQFDAMIEEAQVYAEQLRGDMNEFSMTGTLYQFYNGSSQNWQKTLGAFWGWGSADITYEDGLYTMEYTIHVKDRYNFNKGQKDIATGIKDECNGRYAELGWAKSFFTYGEATRIVSWYEGDIQNKTVTVCPLDERE